MFVNFNILNQLGSPAINSNTFANRPAAGQTGRLFVSTDTFEIYRDNGTTWDLIGGPGSSTITGTGTATQVAYFTSSQAIGSSANLYWDNTAGALGINTATPGAELDVHGTGTIAQFNTTAATGNVFLAIQRSGTGLWRIGDTYNSGSNYFELHNTTLASNAIQIAAATNKSILTSLETYSTGVARGNYLDYTLSLANGTTFTSPNTVTALGATLNLNIAGSATIPAGARSGADFFNGINFTSAGTFTVNQASTIRAFSNVTAGWAFNGSAVGTVTHLAGLRVLFPTNSGSAINVTDNYALLINNQNANTGTITYTNRWGIYQEGASDLNYFAGNSLFGTTTNVGAKIAISGYMYISNRPLAQIVFNSTGTYYGQIQNDAGDKWSFARNTVNDGTLGTPIMTWQATNIRVGINTDSPNSIFEIKNTGTGTKSIAAAFRDSSSDGNGLEIYNENGLSSIYSTYYTGAGSNQDLGFYTTTSTGAQNQVMRLTSTQRVGIGTGAPTSKVDIYEALTNTECYLSVRNNRSRNAAVRTQTTLGDYYIGTGIGTDLNRFMLYDANSGQYRFIVTDSGNFLIGTTTDAGYKLSVNGNTSINGYLALFDYITPSNNYYLSYFYGIDNSYRINYNGSGNDELILSNTGNLQIGGSYKSATPNGGTAAEWKLGSRVAATVALDTTQYIEVDIGGTLYKLAIVT